MKKNKEWEKEFNKYVYTEDDGQFIHTKVREELLEHDLFELKPPKGGMEHMVRMLIWYGETNRNVIRDAVESLTQAEDNMRKRCLETLNKLDSIFVDFDEEDTKNATVTPVVRRTDVTRMILDQATQNINNLDKHD